MRVNFVSGLLALAVVDIARAATAEEWRSRSIYQIMTDRYALTNGSNTAPCDPSLANYCGGSWRGIINNLDYIQNMGFDAVRMSFKVCCCERISADFWWRHRYGYLQWSPKFRELQVSVLRIMDTGRIITTSWMITSDMRQTCKLCRKRSMIGGW